MWVLRQTTNPKEAKKLLATNVVGEISARTLPEKGVFGGGGQNDA
jgi:hypothetical protein